MAASPALFRNPHCPVLHQKPASKSYSNLFCKTLIIGLVLLVIPLFPVQAPDFISQSILSKFWELFHLLVIGIAVSYGLFCRKCTKTEIENQPRNDYGSHAYFSGVMNVSSFFENGCEDLCNSDETKSTQNWDFMYLKNESMSKARSSVDDGKKIRSLKFGNGVKYIYEADKENVGQIWNSQYFQGENLVVVADGNYALDEHKPLGLPVRSLRSSIGDAEKTEFGRSNGSSSSLKGSFGNHSTGKVQKFRSPVTINLENKFDEVAGPSTIRWQSRSDRTEMREVSNVQPPCHCRNHSGGNFEVQNDKSRPVWHPISSGASSVSSQLSNWKTENVEPKRDLKAFLDMFSRSTVASVDDGASVPTKTRGFSIGSSKELDMPTSKGYFNDSNISAMQGMLDRGKKGSESMKSDAKPSNLAKVLSRGRSVRTIRSGVSASDELKRKEKNSSQIDDNVVARSDQLEAPILAKKVKGGETKDPPVHTLKHNSRKVHPAPKETLFSEFQSDERQDNADSASLSESDLQLGSESEDCQESSDDKESETDLVDNSGVEGSEVDRKADEFIANFRKQMRLQKIASVKRYSCGA